MSPSAAKIPTLPSYSRLSPTGTYEFVLECRKDASSASNVGLNVYTSGFQSLYSAGVFCDQPVRIGPGAAWIYYNINVYESFSYKFSCESSGFIQLIPGNYRCALREADFTSEAMNGIWATLTVRSD